MVVLGILAQGTAMDVLRISRILVVVVALEVGVEVEVEEQERRVSQSSLACRASTRH